MSNKDAAIHAIFSKEPHIQAVYLFGSRASGTAKPESDYDIGIVCSDSIGCSAKEYFSKNRLRLLTELAKAGIERADLVIVNGEDIPLDFEVVRHNRALFIRPGFDSASFFSLALRKFFDFQHTLKIQIEAQKERLLNTVKR